MRYTAFFRLCVLVLTLLSAGTTAFSQEPNPSPESQKPFPLKAYETWERVPDSALSFSHTQTLPKPGIRVGDAIFQATCDVKPAQPAAGESPAGASPECTPRLLLSFELGMSEEFRDPVSGDTVRAFTLAGNAPAFFEWKQAGSAPKFVLVSENGTVVMASEHVSYAYVWAFTDKGLTVTSVTVTLKGADDTELASRTFTRHPKEAAPPQRPQGEK